MKIRFLKSISSMALASVLTLTVTQISVFAQSAQKQQGIEGVWDVRITVVQCDTGKVISTGGRAMLMFINGGGVTQLTPTSCVLPVWVRGIIPVGETIPRVTGSSPLTRMAASPEPKQPRRT